MKSIAYFNKLIANKNAKITMLERAQSGLLRLLKKRDEEIAQLQKANRILRSAVYGNADQEAA
jgi:hypothetical protein